MPGSDQQELMEAGTSSDSTGEDNGPMLETDYMKTEEAHSTQESSQTAEPRSGCSRPCVASSSSSCCRICQDSSDTTEVLSTCHCRCKGQLARVHRSCLVEWVRYKGSNRCEICGGIFRGVPNPALGFGVNQIDALEELRQELARYHPISQRKRSTIAGIMLFLLVITGVSAVLTVAADREFQQVAEDPFASEHEVRKAHTVFSICLSFVFFCVTLTMGVGIMWFVLETYFYIHRRRVLNQATTRVVSEARRRSALWGSSVL